MTATYARPTFFKQADFNASKPHEAEVAKHLPPHTIDYTSSNDKLDFFVPGYYLDVKTKGQKLTERWHLLPGVPEEDLFVLDQGTLMKSAEHFPFAFFHLYDIPNDRRFLAPIWELMMCERVTRQRDKRSKFIVDMTQFHPIENDSAHTLCMQLIGNKSWQSHSSFFLTTKQI